MCSAALETAVDMEETIWQSGWDGDWFRRAYDDFGNPVGSQECTGRANLHRTAGHVHHGWAWG